MLIWIKRIVISVILFYLILCILIYFFQEKIIFLPDVLAVNYQYEFEEEFEEYDLIMKDGTILNGLQFKSDSSRGVVLHFHGNAGSLQSWGERSKTYTSLGYDLFLYDYRGYGKSGGSISSQKQLLEDAEEVFKFVQEKYPNQKIVVEGFSIGSGIAAQIAYKHDISQLILLAPYSSLVAVMERQFPILPTFILSYQLKTDKIISKIKAPITILHGKDDEAISFKNSKRLAKLFKTTDKVILLDGVGHNDLLGTEAYFEVLRNLP